MEADIGTYKSKIGDAEYVILELKKTGEFSIDSLVYKLKNNGKICLNKNNLY